MFAPICEVLIGWIGMGDVGDDVGATLTFLGLVIALAYIAARIMLLVLAFNSLRSLPPGAYETVSWTNYILHL
ncbi:hypothetical protein JAAARDRAFT_40957 [Jaapia argillacea MUCL 33604]|uniref:CSC1/OSCA1-like 7TM region domain-containing protein n=1 Tax=Jaapia argillacea MUCL 33604 TaxID=933084 RepID=A0A067PN12_9AGAM|nr:hypothetical protein JAAARDRAFT_40957 [Jaapia argillacea MUCL 33604]